MFKSTPQQGVERSLAPVSCNVVARLVRALQCTLIAIVTALPATVGLLLAATAAHAEGTVPYTAECQNSSWQAGNGPQTRMCTDVAACQRAVTWYGNVGEFQGIYQPAPWSTNRYCRLSSFGLLPLFPTGFPGNVSCGQREADFL